METKQILQMKKTKLKFIKFDGVKIEDGLCTSLPTRIHCNDFPFYTLSSVSAFFSTDFKKTEDGKTKSSDTSLTHTEILKWLNESESFEYRNGELVIYHSRYTFFVEVQ